MLENQIDCITIYFFYTIQFPPAYIEAILLFEYFKEHKKLPSFNNSF